MTEWRQFLRRDPVAALLSMGDPATAYFTKRDLLGELGEPLGIVWTLPEPQRILAKQLSDGSWAGPKKAKPVYPENHATLVATFKQFRVLVERHEFTGDVEAVARAAEFLFSFQSDEGDIRGFIANQYATYYTGYVLSLLTRASYADDPRVGRAMDWLLSMRQDDGGWTIPILTHRFDGETKYRLTSSYATPVEPDRSQPFSHNWTDMVLRAFAIHPTFRLSEEARTAGELLKSQFFERDTYPSYQAPRYWVRFAMWWPNLLTAVESLSMLGFDAHDDDIQRGIEWFLANQRDDGLWDIDHDPTRSSRSNRSNEDSAWITLRICRVLKRLLGDNHGVDTFPGGSTLHA